MVTTFVKGLFQKTRHWLFYGIFMAILIFVLKWLQWKFLILDHSMEIYAGLIAVFFTLLGIWVATQLSRTKVETVIVEKEVYLPSTEGTAINEAALQKFNFTQREYEVLQLLAKGYSNAEIAESLFLALSTVKTHVSNIFIKMDVKSRSQTIEKAKRLRITA